MVYTSSASANIMTRNQMLRVEIACPVYDSDIKNFIADYVSRLLSDNVKSRKLMPDGEYVKPEIRSGEFLIDAQRYYIDNPTNYTPQKAEAGKKHASGIKIKFES